MKKILIATSLVLLFVFGWCWNTRDNNPSTSIEAPNNNSIPNTQKENLPVKDFYKRISKKSFGDYISPTNSPISPERFEGFHTGVDVEFEDVEEKVPVYAICEGEIIFSDWISGYGGVLITKCIRENFTYSVLYGHLDVNSITNEKIVSKFDIIANLGEGNTIETDFERKHLHFGIHMNSIDLRGYVDSKNDLKRWLNPTVFINNIQ